jgi:autotransporter-associated beta strand protein
LSASIISNQVTFSWSSVANASTYVVRRATSISGPYTIVDDPESLSFFVDAGLNYNTTYYYEVAAASLGGISANSGPLAATTTPAPPSPITAVPGNAQVFVDWGDALGATNYVLQRSTTSGGPYSTIVSTTNSSYLDTGVVNGTTYYYVAYAVGPSGTGPISAQTTATPSVTPQMIKSDTTNMNSAADWSGVTPSITQVGLFNNIISAVNEAALVLGGNVSIGGLIFTNNVNGPVTIASANTLTLGAAGIDMSRVNQSVTFNNAVTLAAHQVWNVTNGRTLTLSGTFTSASNTVIKSGSGTLALNGSSSDSGANIQVNAGVVQANTSSGIMISLNGGTFNVNVADGNPMNVMSGGTEQNVGGNRTWSGILTGSGPLTVIASSTHTWSGNNSAYTGTITLQGSGALRLNSVNAVSGATAYNLNGGTMNANTAGLFVLGSLAGSGTINTAVGENFSFGLLGNNTTFSGNIGGAGFVVKDGGGVLTLTGANTYTGGTTVSNGILMINNTSGSGTGSGVVMVNSGGALSGTGIISGPVTVISGSTLAPGNPFGPLTMSNNLTLSGGSTTFIQINHSPRTNGAVRIIGGLTEGGTLIVTNAGAALNNGDSFALFNAASYNGAFANVVLPQLPAGLGWNTNSLATDGVVSVVVASAPFIYVSTAAGGLAFAGTGGVANANFYLLGSSDLTMPASNWTRVLTNQFDSSGNFNVTNAPDPTWPQGFYRLQLP